MKTTNKVVRSRPSRLTVAVPVKQEFSYEKDFFKWTQDQSRFLKKEEFSKLDIEHLREEIESLGISLQRALESYLSTLLMHKLKIKYQPAMHTNSWDNSIKNSAFQIEKLIRKNPSLKTHIPELFKDAYYSARLEASSETGLEINVFPEKCPWDLKEIVPNLGKKQT